MLNKIVVMGRLTQDPEIKTVGSQNTSVTSFSIACERDFKKKDGEKDVDFINVQAWRQTADFICNYFSKGRMIVVEGRLQMRKYQDKEGNNRTAAEVVADNVYFGDSKPSEGGTAVNQYVGGSVDVSTGEFEPLESDDGNLPF